MKISDKNKGLIPKGSVLEEYFEYDEEFYASVSGPDTEEEIEEQAERDRQIMLALEEKAAKEKEWEAQGTVNYDRLRQMQKDGKLSNTNYIGERVLYLRNQLDLEPIDVYEPAGISKSTLYRVEQGEHAPTESVIQKILYALQISLADFACFPDDFEHWKSIITEPDSSYDVYKFRDEVLEKLSRYSFSYKNSGKTIKFPRAHINLLKKLIESSFEVLDIVPHDET